MKKTKNDKYITITRRKGDYSLLFSVILLSVVGTIFIYSASRYSALSTYNDSLYFVKKQIIGILLGIAAMIFTSFYNYNKLKKFTIPVSIIAFVLLCLVFVPGIGVENYGAKRWIVFGGFTLQPSEIAKFALILFTASYVSGNPDKIKTFVGILPVLVVGGIICLLIILEPNMSITICTVLLVFGLLFAAGMKIKHFAFLIIPAFLGGVALIFLEPYRINRLLAFIDPWANPKGE